MTRRRAFASSLIGMAFSSVFGLSVFLGIAVGLFLGWVLVLVGDAE